MAPRHLSNGHTPELLFPVNCFLPKKFWKDFDQRKSARFLVSSGFF